MRPPAARLLSTLIDTPARDPFCYTAGRWLREDSRRRSERALRFSFDRLCQKVIESSSGAQSIKSWRKLEGGFNRVFIMALDNGQTRVARIPYPGVGLPVRWSTSSEVATITYLQQKTSIPVPKLLDWSYDPSGPVGAEYIIMEEARGVPLSDQWHKMQVKERIHCVKSIFTYLSELTNIEFPAYGSLYSQNDLQSCRESRIPLDGSFCVGPYSDVRYWDAHNDSRDQFDHPDMQGPFPTMEEFANSLVNIGTVRVRKSTPESILAKARPDQHGSAEEHLQLLEIAHSCLTAMSRHPDVIKASAPVLFHPDLHMRNIFVSESDPSQVTDIIDWQGASIEPALWYSDHTPDFASNDEGNELVAQAFAACQALLMPRLWSGRQIDLSLSRPFLYSYRTWKDGIAVYRQELIDLQRDWGKLGFEGQCPLPELDASALAAHQHQFNLFSVSQTLKRDIAALLDISTDGWVPTDAFERAQAENEDLFRGALQSVFEHQSDTEEVVRDEDTLRAVWPFELLD